MDNDAALKKSSAGCASAGSGEPARAAAIRLRRTMRKRRRCGDIVLRYIELRKLRGGLRPRRWMTLGSNFLTLPKPGQPR